MDTKTTDRRESSVTSDRLLPYGLQFVLLADCFRICPRPSAPTRKLLERWFWVTSFTGWFGGANSTRVRLALEEIRGVASGTRDTFEEVDLDAVAQPFPSRFDGRSARLRAFMLYLASLKPRSVVNAQKRLHAGAELTRRGSLGYVVSSGIRGDLMTSPANRLYLDSSLAGQAITPLHDLSPKSLDRVLDSHGFGEGAADLLDAREELITQRLSQLIEGEREFMERIDVTVPIERIADAVRDSDTSDDTDD